MKKIYSIILLLCIGVTLSAQNLLEEANQAYTKNDFGKAIELYNKVLKESGESSGLYYNLGNAYFKDKQFAAAILNYERSLLLQPGNEDARFNLEIARTRIVDKIEPIEPFFLTAWIDSFRDTVSSNGWAVTAIISFLLIIGCLFLYFFTRNVITRKIGFFAGLALICLCITANLFAMQQKKRVMTHDQAIVFAPTVTIKSTPDNSGTDLFVLHEGAKVSILSRVGDWLEILLADGNRGWIQSSKLEII